MSRLNPAAMKKLQKYKWPGNIRELQHAVERAVIMSETQVLQPQDFLLTTHEGPQEGLILDSLNLDAVEKIVIQ